jgi:ribosomal protein S1
MTDRSNETSPSSLPRRKIKIGSQRDAEVTSQATDEVKASESVTTPAAPDRPTKNAPATSPATSPVPMVDEKNMASPTVTEDGKKQFPPPRIQRLPEDVQKEIDEALDGVSLDDLMTGPATSSQRESEPTVDERYRASIVKIHREDVFFDLPGSYEGIASMRQFDETPEIGDELEVIVRRFNAEEGLFELTVPGKSVSVTDWSDLQEGTIVQAQVTGHNTGGLECEVNRIRAFMPISQVSLYRVEDLDQFVGEKFTCVVTEANSERRNLVISRRAMLEREREAAKEKMLASLHVGKELEGIVRNIRDFGAFVDLGGVDGLVHISKLSWDRVNHPSDVLEEGQRIKVKIEKIDEETGKIGLSYRDTLEHPWQNAEQSFPVGTIVEGRVAKTMDFGAFVRIAPGIEGLVHVSELAHHRVTRVDSIVRQGQEVQVKVLAIDPDNQRISLSIKAVQQPSAKSEDSRSEDEPDEPLRDKATKTHSDPLKGGTNRNSGGEQFGLNW